MAKVISDTTNFLLDTTNKIISPLNPFHEFLAIKGFDPIEEKNRLIRFNNNFLREVRDRYNFKNKINIENTAKSVIKSVKSNPKIMGITISSVAIITLLILLSIGLIIKFSINI